MGRAFITQDDFQGWVKLESPNAAVLQTCIEAACEMIENKTRRRVLSGSYAVWHSGDRAVTPDGFGVKSDLYLCDPNGGHLLIPITAIGSIKEEGTTLTSYLMSTVTTFTDSDYAVLIFDKTGIARRVSISNGIPEPKSWEGGHANIYTSITAGYSLGSDVPYNFQHFAKHMTTLLYREGRRAGVAQLNDGNVSLGFERLLPPLVKEGLELETWPAVPRTYEG